MKSKRGQNATTAIALLVFIAILAIGALIVTSIRTSVTVTTANTTAMNLTDAGLSMFDNMRGLIPVIGIVFIAGIVIFFVVRGLGGSGAKVAGGGGAKGGNF